MSTRLCTAFLALSSSLTALSAGIAGPPLGSEFQINTYTTSSQWFSSVAASADGDFVVVWESYTQDGSAWGVFGQRYDSAGTRIGSEFRVNTHTADEQYRPSVASNAAGDFVVAWQSRHQDGSDDGIFAQRFDAAGNPLAGEFQVNTYTTDAQYEPTIAMDDDGDFVVAWTSLYQDGDLTGIYAQRFDAVGNRLGEEFRVNTDPKGQEMEPSAASAPDGSFVVVWRENEYFAIGGVLGQRYDSSGLPLGGEFQINSYGTNRQSEPSVSMDENGAFVVAWTSFGQDGHRDGVFAQRFGRGGNRNGGEFQVNTHTLHSQRSPAVAMSPEGEFVIVWASDQDGSGYGVYAQEFHASGDPRGAETRVNTYTTLNQSTATIAMDAEGDYVVVWASNNQDGDRWGVFGQRFAKPALTLSVIGGCPGEVVARVTDAPPRAEVGLVVAANNSGFVKGGSVCAGTVLEIGEPFVLPPTWVFTDENGAGSATLLLPGTSCWVQALALANCSTSNAVEVP